MSNTANILLGNANVFLHSAICLGQRFTLGKYIISKREIQVPHEAGLGPPVFYTDRSGAVLLL